jgi:hypothetical protein
MLVYLNECKSLVFVLKYRFVISKFCFMRTVWKVFCICAQYTFLMYRLERIMFLCTVHISDVPSGKCYVSVHSTYFWCNVWKGLCFCAQYTFLMYRLESALFCAQYTFLKCRLESVLFLCTVHISDYRLESVFFLCTVHISDVPSGKCSVSVHSTKFWCTAWKVLFLCTVHISDVPSGKCFISMHSTHFWCPNLWYLCNRFLVQVFCFSCCFVVMLPYWRQFQSLSNM